MRLQVLEVAHQSSSGSRVSVPELIHQLQVTQNELENIRVSMFACDFHITLRDRFRVC